MYGIGMTARLSKQDWLDHGLKVLATSGVTALKAEPLAKSLNVSRGSFYWHFADIGKFRQELLARWQARVTENTITEIERQGETANRLNRLMQIAMQADDKLERAVRSWATQDPVAGKSVTKVDKIRLGYLSEILQNTGIPKRHANARAQFIYWAWLGQIMMGKSGNKMKPGDINALSELMKS